MSRYLLGFYYLPIVLIKGYKQWFGDTLDWLKDVAYANY